MTRNIRAIAQASARTAYVAMCLSLCWGIFVATGWIGRLTGRDAMRGSHVILATLAIVTARFTPDCSCSLPTPTRICTGNHCRSLRGKRRGTLGTGDHWSGGDDRDRSHFSATTILRLPKLAERAPVRLPGGSPRRRAFLAGRDGERNLALLWLAGLTVLVPTVLLSGLRFMPARFLVSLGLLTD